MKDTYAHTPDLSTNTNLSAELHSDVFLVDVPSSIKNYSHEDHKDDNNNHNKDECNYQGFVACENK